jgi:hypothetical protein
MPYKKGFLKGIAFTNKINKRLRRRKRYKP